MTDHFNPELLVLARESRGFTQSEVAGSTGIAQSLISKYENGIHTPSPEHLAKLASALSYSASLFALKELPLRAGVCLFHRKQASMSQRDLRRIQASVKMARLHVGRLLASSSLEPAMSFPRYDIADYSGDTAVIAAMVRLAWRMPDGPVPSMVEVVERAGGIVVGMDFGNRKLSALCHPETPPLFCVNTTMPCDRIRFTLAHEIGHLVMHHVPTESQEAEADRFASDFLMPEQDVVADLHGMSISRAAELKMRWKVSMQAIVRRARDLGAISADRYTGILIQFSKRGWRLKEPVDLPLEQPHLLADLVSLHREDLGYSNAELADLLCLSEEELRSRYLGEPWRPRIVK